VVNPLVYKRLEFDPEKDFEPVILVVKTSNLITVSNSLPAGTLAELIALSKSKVGGITYGFPGNGTTGHFTGALLNKVARIGMVPVPYKGTTQVQADLIGGTLDVAVDNITTWAPLAQTGRVRAVAVTGAVRSALLPDVPTVQESGYAGFEATSFAGIASIAGTPLAIIQKLNADIALVIKSPEFGKRFSGGEAGGGSPEDFKRHIAAERQKWGEVAKTISLNND
jgi:tripartite-type tricarboxylate transporter receptor subunit TctC